MAMDKDRLGDAIVTRLQSLNGNIGGSDVTFLQPYWRAIADEIIKEIIANMEITTNVTVENVQVGGSTVNGTGEEDTIS